MSGRIVVDAGAERALLKKGSSLLGVGLTAIEGDFGIGDIVTIVSLTGQELGRGLTDHSSTALRSADRAQSGVVVIHRNNLFLHAYSGE